MFTKEFDYCLPKNLIAQTPIKPRDSARLLILDKKTGAIKHDNFFNLEKYLQPNDVLVFNNSKVIPARLIGKKDSGGIVEIFLLQKIKTQKWETLIKGKIKVDQSINLAKNIKAKIITKKSEQGIATYQLKFNCSDKKLFSIGQTPTPPYIKKKSNLTDYQNVYAKNSGSVAAPTAGLHFTKNLIAKLKKRGIKIEYVTLHVGLGTFAPVKAKQVKNHKTHSELAVLDSSTAKRLNQAKKNGARIIAVGTTSVRTLEAFSNSQGILKAQKRWVNIFIYPGYKFKFINLIITNFHLPRSSLIMLVAALTGKELILKTYQKAIRKKYRFYSFGDGMLIK